MSEEEINKERMKGQTDTQVPEVLLLLNVGPIWSNEMEVMGFNLVQPVLNPLKRLTVELHIYLICPFIDGLEVRLESFTVFI